MKRLYFLFIPVLFSSSLLASWENPILLSELNDFLGGSVASRPLISSDENTIYFVRGASEVQLMFWEAKKNPQTGIFDQQRIVSELNELGGRNIFGAWISEDSLRLYYCADSSRAVNGKWGRNLRFAIRRDSDDKWVPYRLHSELQTDQYVSSVSLTADELNIMWTSSPDGGQKQIFMASRPSLFHAFSGIQEMPDLEAIGAMSPYLSLDGLTVYFMRDYSTNRQAWSGHRSSLNDTFDSFCPIDEINALGNVFGNVCPSWDGNHAYYWQKQGVLGDLNAMGIFVSQWEDNSFADAVRNMQEAESDKEMALQLVQEASEKELKAQQILNALSTEEGQQLLDPKTLNVFNQKINQARSRQEQVIKTLQASLTYLRLAILPLVSPVQNPE